MHDMIWYDMRPSKVSEIMPIDYVTHVMHKTHMICTKTKNLLTFAINSTNWDSYCTYIHDR